MQRHPLVYADFISWDKTVPEVLDAANFADFLDRRKTVLLKPNLVEPDKPPITTPVGLVAAIIEYIRKQCGNIRIIVAEGAGSIDYNTSEIFEELGYTELAKEMDVELLDLNSAPTVCLKKPGIKRCEEMHLPSICMESFLISIPTLKAHSLADVTLSMKNMIGIAPPSHYNAGSWKKSAFHERIQEAIFELNMYRHPDFSILDATVGMAEAHLWGPTCNPPPNIVAASADCVAIDAYGAGLLKKDWRKIGHISMADGILGFAEPRV